MACDVSPVAMFSFKFGLVSSSYCPQVRYACIQFSPAGGVAIEMFLGCYTKQELDSYQSMTLVTLSIAGVCIYLLPPRSYHFSSVTGSLV